MALRSFGYVAVVAAGTPVRASSNLTLQTGQNVPLQSLLIEAHPANTGKIYIIEGMPATPVDRRTTGVGVIAILPKPADATIGPFPSANFGLPATPQSINLREIWLDADVSGDKVIVSGTVG